MEKSDTSIHAICIASIKRSTIKPYDFKWTRFYEENAVFKNSYPAIELDLSANELVICSSIMDNDNFSVVTTQNLLTKEKGIASVGNLNGALIKEYGDFKGYEKEPFTFGIVQLDNGNEFKYFIETGNASMVMIHGVKTRIRVNHMTSTQVTRVGSIWTKKANSSGGY